MTARLRPAARGDGSSTAYLPAGGLPMRELDFQRLLVATKPKPGLAVMLGWEHIHFRPALTKAGYRTPGSGSMARGWPDLTLVRERDHRLIFAELKSDKAALSPDQERVLEVLRSLTIASVEIDGTGDDEGFVRGVSQGLLISPRIEVHVWRPRDLDDIVRILR